MKEPERLWKATFDAINDEVCIVDADGGVLICNKAAEKKMGITTEKLAGRKICKYVHGTEEHLLACPFQRMKKTLKREELEITAGGRWLLVCVDPILGERGELTGAVHVIKDITQRKKEEEEMELNKVSMQRAAVATFWMNASGEILYTNDAASRNLGYRKEDLVGKTIHEVDPQFPQLTWSRHWQELKNNKTLMFETVHQRRDGSTFPVEVTANYLEFNGKEYNLAFAVDVTERQRALRALKESEEKYRKVVEAANDAIMLFDSATGKILDANTKAEELTGRDEAELVGMPHVKLHPENEAGEYEERFNNFVKSGANYRDRGIIVHKDGHNIPVQISANVVDLKDRKIVIAIFSDISELKMTEYLLRSDKAGLEMTVDKTSKQLSRAQKELEDSKRLSDLGVLAATIAHELRNPLGVIKVAAYNIKRKCQGSPVPVDNHIASIDKKVAESESIIRNLLRYARIRMPQYEKVNILELINECMGHSRDAFKDWDARVELVNDTKQKEVTCEADPVQLTEVFTNIIVNAFQAFPGKKGTVEIRIENDKIDPSEVKIKFKDDGIGIDEEDIPKIFTPFFTKKAKGTGLGLAVCEQIARLHGGTITVESKKGRGTTMTVTLPKART